MHCDHPPTNTLAYFLVSCSHSSTNILPSCTASCVQLTSGLTQDASTYSTQTYAQSKIGYAISTLAHILAFKLQKAILRFHTFRSCMEHLLTSISNLMFVECASAIIRKINHVIMRALYKLGYLYCHFPPVSLLPPSPLSLPPSLSLSHTHTHTHKCTQTHTHTHKQTHTYKQTHTHKHTHKHTRTHTQTHTHAQTHTQIHTHTNKHTHTQTNTHTHKHTHTNTQTHTHKHTRALYIYSGVQRVRCIVRP